MAAATAKEATVKSIRQTFLALAVAALFSAAAPVSAVSLSLDQSDLWYIPAESGWGMQLVQRNTTIFATLFVYDSAMNPTWYVATMNFVSGQTWSGDLYATTGPWFGTMPFNPALVKATQVGTMTWTAGYNDNGNVVYSVNGTAVSKYVVREPLVLVDYSGHFSGVIHQTGTNCTNTALNGTTDTVSVLSIAQSGSNFTLTSLPAGGGSCTYSGTLSQYGQMGAVGGTYTCSNSYAGQFSMFELQVTEISVNGYFIAAPTNPAGCEFSGWLGGVIVTTF